ncbi:hypothetical protein U1Q18_051974 [Sarracenia purpurea var. burkii]
MSDRGHCPGCGEERRIENVDLLVCGECDNIWTNGEEDPSILDAPPPPELRPVMLIWVHCDRVGWTPSVSLECPAHAAWLCRPSPENNGVIYARFTACAPATRVRSEQSIKRRYGLPSRGQARPAAGGALRKLVDRALSTVPWRGPERSACGRRPVPPVESGGVPRQRAQVPQVGVGRRRLWAVAARHHADGRGLRQARPWLLRQIALIKPRVIVALGAPAWEYLRVNGDVEAMQAARGDPDDKSSRHADTYITRVQGQMRRLTIQGHECIVIPVCHPSFILRKFDRNDPDKPLEPSAHSQRLIWMGHLQKAFRMAYQPDTFVDYDVEEQVHEEEDARGPSYQRRYRCEEDEPSREKTMHDRAHRTPKTTNRIEFQHTHHQQHGTEMLVTDAPWTDARCWRASRTFRTICWWSCRAGGRDWQWGWGRHQARGPGERCQVDEPRRVLRAQVPLQAGQAARRGHAAV